MTAPKRGQVWVDGEGFEYLVLSIDSYNRSGMRDVVALRVYNGDLTEEDTVPYATVVSFEGEERTIFSDDLVVVSKLSLIEAVWHVGSDFLDGVAEDLSGIITPASAVAPARRLRGYPLARQIRFADLHIPGEADKPVVVISSEKYGEDVGYAFVVACRVSSDPTKIRKYDVELISQTGKVVCSAVQTVPLGELRDRTTRGAAAVSSKEAAEILAKVRALLGLE